MAQRRPYKDGEKIHLGFQANARLANACHQAADRAKVSSAEWLRDMAIAAAAKTLGVSQKELRAEPEPVRQPTLVTPTVTPEAQELADLKARLAELEGRVTGKRDRTRERAVVMSAPAQQTLPMGKRKNVTRG
jgi:hypothetical protein